MRDPTALASTTPKSRKVKRVMVLGATGTVGAATVRALVEQGYDVTCFVRPKAGFGGNLSANLTSDVLHGADVRFGEITKPGSLKNHGFQGEQFDVLLSCLASRSGDPKDAWAIDHKAHELALECAIEAGVRHMVLLSAICVQKPKLAFQFAKLAFEKQLIESGITYSIVRPTALFKSLSGQINRTRQGKSFMVFGNGALTACKPISNRDLAHYLAQCIEDLSLHNRILPIGGPGPAITPLQQGEKLFAIAGRKPKFFQVPVILLDTIIGGLAALGFFIPACARKVEFARIGRYYATESMLVFDPKTNRYDETLTPSTGTETLFDFYREQMKSEKQIELGDHSVFQ
jgi:divinyl chlorophyllide a 8-vinyl-reductase